MVEASTDVVLGEVIGPAAEAQRRVYGVGFGLVLLCSVTFAVFAVLGPWVGLWLRPAIGGWSDLVAIAFLVGAGIGAIAMYSKFHRRGFLRNLKKFGSPESIRTHFRFDEEGIAVDTSRLSHRLPWSAVQIVVRSSDYWLLQIDITTLAVPRRAFACEADEQAFVELAKSGLTKTARQRSVFENQ